MSISTMATRPAPPRGPPGAPLGKVPAVPQNQTIYIRNLNDKLPKADLRLHLYMLFTTFGPVLDVVALKTSKMRGQAHITFRDVSAAQQAMVACEGMEFFGKNMKIQYAKSRSDKIKKLEGTYSLPTKATPGSKVTAQETDNMTDLQRSIFDRAPGSGLLPSAPGLPPKPNLALPVPPPGLPRVSATPEPAQGQKRSREPEPDEEEEEEMPMDVDDEGSAMEESEED